MAGPFRPRPIRNRSAQANATASAAQILDWFNQQVGKTQRLARLILTRELPRSAIGKVLKRELREQFVAEQGVLD